MTAIDEFFIELDQRWVGQSTIDLLVIGCGALMLQLDYERGTKDSDIFETMSLSQTIKDQLVQLAGRGTELAKRRRMFIEIVPNGLPFLPRPARWVKTSLEGRLKHFEIRALDVLDVVIAKLARFNVHDVSDIDAMCRRELVDTKSSWSGSRARMPNSASRHELLTCRGSSTTCIACSATCSGSTKPNSISTRSATKPSRPRCPSASGARPPSRDPRSA